MLVDVDEQALLERDPTLLKLLLRDNTTGRNIVWATEDHASRGSGFGAEDEITVDAITGENAGILQPRVEKVEHHQLGRTKERAEVFTPSWLCNEQNNLVDEAWFGRPNVFNRPTKNGWRTNRDLIDFEDAGPRSWKRYVDERRMEVACGEAPYLVSRYDATTGAPIKLERRIGLLDRKMRVVQENTTSEEEWLNWSLRAVQSIYGFELQGDSLLLARENILASYTDYARAALRREPSRDELRRVARVISWNLWQMDAFTQAPPFHEPSSPELLPTLFDTPAEDKKAALCRIRDWRGKKTTTFAALADGN
ncbi:restriction endonuclease subunit M [Actinomyces minihominis]|uniref:restriction endonuclease subunit M n=1 Tax=Actinomyces minihominis TaxID=2002838 RepID=UPI000C0737F6|nr:restriction endonuclease subunit M [Actinomyces minihominis]